MPGIVTTAPSGDSAEAQELAARFGLRFEEREGRPVHELPKPALVLSARRADLYEKSRVWRATPGMAHLRVLRLRKGEPDPLAAWLQPGDSVLDATLGLGGDALVAAHATGAAVVGLEANGLLAAFTAAGLARVQFEAARRIRVVRADHREYLQERPGGSFDVVLLDPMFRKAADAGPLFELLRAHAEHARLEKPTLQEALRVARRGVLVKDAAPGHELHRLGLAPRMTRRSANIAFGWLPKAKAK